MWTKTGIHAQRGTEPAIKLARVSPGVKSVGDVGILQAAPDSAIRVYRRYYEYQDFEAQRGGRDIADEVIASLNGYTHPKLYLEAMNEWRQFTHDGLAYHIEFTREFAQRCHERGFKCAAFSFSVGCPEPVDWELIKASGILAEVDALALHEYWSQVKDNCHEPWTALRHRLVHEWLGGQHPPILITEAGCDATYGQPSGWKSQGISADEYIRQITEWDAELQRDDYVMGAAIFTAGPYGWESFEIDSIADQIIAATAFLGNAPEIPDSSDGGETMPETFEYVLGFAEYAKQHPEIGEPTSGLMYDANGTATQYTEHGMLQWNKAANQTLFFAAAR